MALIFQNSGTREAMPKRSISELDWGDSLSHCPQSKIQVGNKEINQGICSDSNMKAVYSKTFLFYFHSDGWLFKCAFLISNSREDIESSLSRFKSQTKSTRKYTTNTYSTSNKFAKVFSNHHNFRWTNLTTNWRTSSEFLPHTHLTLQLHVMFRHQFQCLREVQVLWGNLLRQVLQTLHVLWWGILQQVFHSDVSLYLKIT